MTCAPFTHCTERLDSSKFVYIYMTIIFVSYYNTSGISIYTADGSLNKTRNAGTVIIDYDGKKGYICDSYWLDTDAQVVCKSMGFVDGASKLA